MKTQNEKFYQLFAIKLKLQNHLLLIFFMLNDYYQLNTNSKYFPLIKKMILIDIF